MLYFSSYLGCQRPASPRSPSARSCEGCCWWCWRDWQPCDGCAGESPRFLKSSGPLRTRLLLLLLLHHCWLGKGWVIAETESHWPCGGARRKESKNLEEYNMRRTKQGDWILGGGFKYWMLTKKGKCVFDIFQPTHWCQTLSDRYLEVKTFCLDLYWTKEQDSWV